MSQTSTFYNPIHSCCGHACSNASSSSSVPRRATHSNNLKDDTAVVIKDKPSRRYLHCGPRPSSAPSSPRPRPLPIPPVGPGGSITQRPHSDILLGDSRSLLQPVLPVSPRPLPRPGCHARPLPVPGHAPTPSMLSVPSLCPSSAASRAPSPLPSPSPSPRPSLAICIVNPDGVESTETEDLCTSPHACDAMSPIIFSEPQIDDLLEPGMAFESHRHKALSSYLGLDKSSTVAVCDSRVSRNAGHSSHPVEGRGKPQCRSRSVLPCVLQWAVEKKGKRWTGRSTDFQVVVDELRKL